MRDAARPVAPLRQEPDAFLLDTTELTIDQAVDTVLRHFRQYQASAYDFLGAIPAALQDAPCVQP
jgi:cytidylate kinase